MTTRLLADSPNRSYARKLDRFAAFAAPELESIVSDLKLPKDGTALDLGCGTGLATALLADHLGPAATVVGLDLSLPHFEAASGKHRLPLIQGDAEQLCFRDAAFDLVWCCNTVNHVRHPVACLRALRRTLRADGRLVLAQRSFCRRCISPGMRPLDDAVRTACHRYYRERYGLQSADTAGIRAVVGLLRAAGFAEVAVRTYVLERIQPLSQVDRDYFREAVFEGLWGARIHPYLDPEQRANLEHNCNPASPGYCLDRPDFHHPQTLTVFAARP